MDVMAASVAADSGHSIAPYGPSPRAPAARPSPTNSSAVAVQAGDGQPSASFGIRKQLFEAEAKKDELRMQLQSIMTQFHARESWWRTNVMEAKDQVIDGVFRNQQFEFEARQQWEQRLRNVEALVDEASSYCEDQSKALKQRTDTVINLEAQMVSMRSQAVGEVARLSHQVHEESQTITRYRGEAFADRKSVV